MMQGRSQYLLFSPSLYPCVTGGYELYNYHLFNHLVLRKSPGTFLISTSCRAYADKQENAYRMRMRLFGLRRWGLGGLSALIWVIFHKRIRIRDLSAVYTSYVGSMSSDSMVFLLLLRQVFRVPYILHIHGGGMLPWKPRFLHAALFKHAERIAGVSEPICREYEKRAGRKVDLILPIMPFLEPDDTKEALRQRLDMAEFGKIILYVGSMKALKAPEVLLNAFLRLDESFVEEHKLALLYCGDGPLREELEAKSINSPRSSRIRFMGNVNNEEISNFYAISDIFVMPSWFEGTPIALMQAMKMGLTAIGTNVSGINKLISHGENGLLFEKDDFARLADLLQEVLEGQYDLEKLSGRAMQKINDIHNYQSHLDHLFQYISGRNYE